MSEPTREKAIARIRPTARKPNRVEVEYPIRTGDAVVELRSNRLVTLMAMAEVIQSLPPGYHVVAIKVIAERD